MAYDATLKNTIVNEVLNGEDATEVAGRYGVSRTTVYKWMKDMEWEAPDIPSKDIPVEQIIENRKVRYEARKEHFKVAQWMTFKMKVKGPFALAFMGDPHMDDNGCNWPLLERDIGLIRDTEAMYGVCLGDYTNNWVRGLAEKIYPGQETTREQGWELAKWFFDQKKANGQSIWWLLIKGNHDLWSQWYNGGDPLDWMQKGEAVLRDWQAQIQVECPNGLKVPLHIAHDFKGSSIYNPVHGPMRKGIFNGQAAAYICGDKHNWACFEVEDADRTGRTYWAIRARGYKEFDPYAQRLGFGEQQYGATIVGIIDPSEKGVRQLRFIPDVEEAVDFLKYKRSKM